MQWMGELGLEVTIDAIGNIAGVRGGREDLRDDLVRDDLAPVMFGTHVDPMGTGGRRVLQMSFR